MEWIFFLVKKAEEKVWVPGS